MPKSESELESEQFLKDVMTWSLAARKKSLAKLEQKFNQRRLARQLLWRHSRSSRSIPRSPEEIQEIHAGNFSRGSVVFTLSTLRQEIQSGDARCEGNNVEEGIEQEHESDWEDEDDDEYHFEEWAETEDPKEGELTEDDDNYYDAEVGEDFFYKPSESWVPDRPVSDLPRWVQNYMVDDEV